MLETSESLYKYPKRKLSQDMCLAPSPWTQMTINYPKQKQQQQINRKTEAIWMIRSNTRTSWSLCQTRLKLMISSPNAKVSRFAFAINYKCVPYLENRISDTWGCSTLATIQQPRTMSSSMHISLWKHKQTSHFSHTFECIIKNKASISNKTLSIKHKPFVFFLSNQKTPM